MKKITIEICYGTLCFVMGGEMFETLQERLPKEIQPMITIKGMVCPGFCHQQEELGRPPFVKIDDQIISEANPQKIIDSILKRVNHGTNE
ncbi:MAG: hypothetical protein ACP5O2_04715 [Bacteroidales bacterium]